MSSLALIVRPTVPMSHADFAVQARALAEATPTARQLCVGWRPPPRWKVMPLSAQPAALVLADALPSSPAALRIDAYRVHTTEPLAGPPQGAGMITLFSRRRGLDTPTFLRRWHDGHSPLALSVHPLIRYTRHQVLEALGDAPPRDGIVLEMTGRRRDLISPWRFFGGPLRALPNMLRIGLDARRFLDLSTIENQLVNVTRL